MKREIETIDQIDQEASRLLERVFDFLGWLIPTKELSQENIREYNDLWFDVNNFLHHNSQLRTLTPLLDLDRAFTKLDHLYGLLRQTTIQRAEIKAKEEEAIFWEDYDLFSKRVLPKDRPCLYSPILIELIREWSEGKRIVVVDFNNTIADDAGDELNPQAVETLRSLKESGYTIVLWTAAYIDVDFLVRLEIWQYFDLAIFASNYKVTGTVSTVLREIVNTCCWLSDEAKKEILERFSIGDLFSLSKLFFLLFNKAIMFDDSRDVYLAEIFPFLDENSFKYQQVDSFHQWKEWKEGMFGTNAVSLAESFFAN